ncbi:hypothetical protein, partial [Solidesulfovibrio sp.]|uniref:hypothetical protein n=1 Tax=Solidesulfovibrio sp. TaxID=2910990 RepID=UPI002B21D496
AAQRAEGVEKHNFDVPWLHARLPGMTLDQKGFPDGNPWVIFLERVEQNWSKKSRQRKMGY